jgi:hypothetical protein
VYGLISSVLHSFDEGSLGSNLNSLYELSFYCLNDNKYLCNKFWDQCNREERDNLTILLLNSIELFPFCMERTFTFFSLLSQSDEKLWEQVSFVKYG